MDRYQQARRVTIVGALVNVVLGVSKCAIGWYGQSQALVADGLHSLSDLVTDGLVLWASYVGSQDADADHPYGHARIETAVTLALSALLAFVGLAIAVDAVLRLHADLHPPAPESYVLWAAVFSIIANEGIFQYTLRVGKRISSQLLIANAWHSRSDSASSAIVLVGVGASLLGASYLDAIAAVLVGVQILHLGWRLGWDSVLELIDTGLDHTTVQKIHDVIVAVPGVKTLHQLRTRRMGDSVFADVHVLVAPDLSVSEGHYIGERVELALINDDCAITDVVVHVDPEDDEEQPTSATLPARAEIVADLRQRLQFLEINQTVEAVTLHYLSGKVHVELSLPLQAFHGEAEADGLVKSVTEAVSDLGYLASVAVQFTSRCEIIPLNPKM